MNYQETIHYLYELERKGWILGLDRVKDALDSLDHPEKKYKIIHIAGTNGKGSVTAMTAKILHLAGHKVGMFTSPHLASFRERIQINGEQISPDDIIRLVGLLNDKQVDLTFFEYVTVMAFQYFKEQGCEYVVLETGMGGRLDATNVCYAEISAITSIDYDHVHWLGKTIQAIAKEKAGIIKGGGKVIVGKDGNGLGVIEQVCIDKNAQIIHADLYGGLISLRGDFQKQNAGIASMICKELGIQEDFIQEGIATTYWPGRLQFLQEGILFDCAHNVAGMRELAKYVSSIRQEYERLIIVFGVQGKKYYQGMLELLPLADVLIFSQAKVRGGLPPAILQHVSAQAGFVIEEYMEAYHHALAIKGEKDLLLVCGSGYLIGSILGGLEGVTDGWIPLKV